MFHPTRGGTRGGAAYFSWDDVKKDKDRENYLGHSILAPTGRWQKNKDVTWYNKDKAQETNASGSKETETISQASEARKQELMAIKMREEEEMNKRLGIKTDYRKVFQGSSDAQKKEDDERKMKELESGFTKEERKAAKRLAKMEVRQQRREERNHDKRSHNASRHRDSEERRERHSRYADVRAHSDRDRRRSRSPEGSRSHRRSEKHESDWRDHSTNYKDSHRRGEVKGEERRRDFHRSDDDNSRRHYRE